MASTTLDPEEYKELTTLQHVLQRPDMYLESHNPEPREAVVFYEGKLKKMNIIHTPPLEQLFMETLGNVADALRRSQEAGIGTKHVECEITNTSVRFKNYGKVIPVELNANNQWIPSVIFSRFMSGSNFNDDKDRYYVGKNGYGIKLTNAYSKTFQVICYDRDRKRKFTQIWYDNMSQCQMYVNSEGVEVPYLLEEGINEPDGYVDVYYEPDFARFNMVCFDDTAFALYKAHLMAMSFTRDTAVYLTTTMNQYNAEGIQLESLTNQELIDVLDFKDYVKHFNTSKNMITCAGEKPSEGSWECILQDTPYEGTTIAFANGVPLKKGGAIMDEIYRNCSKKVVELLGKVAEGVRLTKTDVERHMTLFINCNINQPKYDSQSKAYLTNTKPKIEFAEEDLKKIKKWDSFREIGTSVNFKMLKKIQNSDKNSDDIDKHRKANLWGDKKLWEECTLILCEGDSAAAYPTTLIGMIDNGDGWDRFGLLSLHGKQLNILTADFVQEMDNKDMKAIRKALGLVVGVDNPDDVRAGLKYGKIMIMTDADPDGEHIAAELVLLFAKRWPSLLYEGRVSIYLSPLVKASKGNQKLYFYTEQSFNKWMLSMAPNRSSPSSNGNSSSSSERGTGGWKFDYNKGLCSNNKKDLPDHLANPKIITLQLDELGVERLQLAFSKENADNRKGWLIHWLEHEVLDIEPYSQLEVSKYFDSVVPHYFVETIYRAIPYMTDGLKEVQRKVVDTAIDKMKGNKSMKVMNISCAAADKVTYDHGEKSMADAICRATLSFPGTNNLPMFEAESIFGTRFGGAKDMGAARYLALSIPWWYKYMYRKEDEPMLSRSTNQGKDAEYKTMLPIIGLHFINGCRGVASGWSSTIPSFNPLELNIWFQTWLSNRLLLAANNLAGKDNVGEGQLPLPFLRPWYNDFKGTIEVRGKQFLTIGNYTQLGDIITVNELPIGVVPVDYYNNFLKKLEEEKKAKKVENKCPADKVRLVIKGYTENPTLRKLRLINKGSFKNMTVVIPGFIDDKDKFTVRTYNDIQDMLCDFADWRLSVYYKRQEYQTAKLKSDIGINEDKLRLVRKVREGDNRQVLFTDKVKQDAELKNWGFEPEILKTVPSNSYTPQLITKLEKIIADLKQQLEDMLATTPEMVWSRELNEFASAYAKHNKLKMITYSDILPPSELELYGKDDDVEVNEIQDEIPVEAENQLLGTDTKAYRRRRRAQPQEQQDEEQQDEYDE